MTNSVIQITTEQSQQLSAYLAQQDYPSAYTHLKEIVESDPNNDHRLADWLDKAAHINANDGSAVSDFVRGATINAAQNEGDVVTEEDFQVASDLLAQDVIGEIIRGLAIPNVDTIISKDVAKVVEDLHLLPQSWAGTAMAWVPYLGLDLDLNSQFYTDLFKEYRDAPSVLVFFNGGILFQQLLDNNLTGLATATESQLSQLLEAAMDHVNGEDVSDNPILDLIKNNLNSFIDDVTTISTHLQSTLESFYDSSLIRRVDPLSLDLDGDGIELVNVNSSTAFFDLDVTQELDGNGSPTGNYISDGVKEQVGWVSSDDGLLTLDRNNNGTVDNILELFGRERRRFISGKTHRVLSECGQRSEATRAQARVVFERSEKSDEALFSRYSIQKSRNFLNEFNLELVANENFQPRNRFELLRNFS